MRLAAAFLVLASAQACAPAPAPPTVPVVFVSIDTLSARHLDLYGYARETAPNLTRFAREAVVFEHCWANAPWTTPSYMSQMSGLLPWAHRVEREPGDHTYPCQLAEERVTLAEAFQASGYRTAAFVDNPNLAPAFGFDQGFEVYDTSAALISKRDHSGGARKVFADGLAWLDALEGRAPYFLFLQALDVHGPYAPTPPYRGAFAGDGLGAAEIEAPVALAAAVQFDAVPRYVAEPSDGGPAPAVVDAAALADAYDEEILQLDAALGDLFEELARRGLLDEAVVVVSADHGESLLEHHSLFSHHLPYEEVAHVPLVVRLPGGRHGGRRVAEPVQLVDLYPTLLGLVGIAFRPPVLHGRSLVPALEGRRLAPAPLVCQGDTFGVQAALDRGLKLVELTPDPGNPQAFASYPPVRAWFAERLPFPLDGVPGTSELPLALLLRASDVALLWEEAQAELCVVRHELYRLAADPDESADLVEREPAEVRRLAAALERARLQAESARARGAPDATRELDPELRGALRDLGYVDD